MVGMYAEGSVATKSSIGPISSRRSRSSTSAWDTSRSKSRAGLQGVTRGARGLPAADETTIARLVSGAGTGSTR